MIVLDTSGLLAVLDADQQDHAAAAAVIRSHRGPLLLSPFVLAEVDFLLATRVGQAAELALLEQVEKGAYRLETFGAGDIAHARLIIEHYAALRLGLADASIMVLADRFGTRDVLTLDQRHFRAMAGPGGRGFRLLPWDA